jgi:hypothetical protein
MNKSEISREAISSKGKAEQKSQAAAVPLRVSDLEWSRGEAMQTRGRLVALEEDWDAPGMEAYDYLINEEKSSS